MPVPVIVVVPAQEPIRESAAAFAEGRRPTRNLREATMPGLTLIDPDLPAVPLGTGRLEDLGTASMAPDQSQAYAVHAIRRGSCRRRPGRRRRPARLRGPYDRPLRDVRHTAALGNVANVATKLKIAALTASNTTLSPSQRWIPLEAGE